MTSRYVNKQVLDLICLIVDLFLNSSQDQTEEFANEIKLKLKHFLDSLDLKSCISKWIGGMYVLTRDKKRR
jgi:hypothetical protein